MRARMLAVLALTCTLAGCSGVPSDNVLGGSQSPAPGDSQGLGEQTTKECTLIADTATSVGSKLDAIVSGLGFDPTGFDDPEVASKLADTAREALGMTAEAFNGVKPQIKSSDLAEPFATFTDSLGQYAGVFNDFDPAAVYAADESAVVAMEQFNADLSNAQDQLKDAYTQIDKICAG